MSPKDLLPDNNIRNYHLFAHTYFARLFMFIVSMLTATTQNCLLFVDEKYVCQDSMDMPY